MDREAQVHAVIALMEKGNSERAACEEVGINRSTFRQAALRYDAGTQYARGLELLAQNQAELLEEAIQDMRSGKVDAAMARVEIDARKWFASKFLPKRYGDRQIIAGDSENPLEVRALPAEQLSAKVLALAAEAGMLLEAPKPILSSDPES